MLNLGNSWVQGASGCVFLKGIVVKYLNPTFHTVKALDAQINKMSNERDTNLKYIFYEIFKSFFTFYIYVRHL